MTMPAEPATGDPAPVTGDPSQQPTPAPANDPGQQPATGDWATVFEGLTPEQVKAKLDHARTWEKRAKDNKKAFDDLKAKGQPADGEPTPDDLKAQLEQATAAREEAEIRAVELTYETTVTRIAAQVGADAEALLDSQKFRDAVAAELDDDGFDDDDLKAAVNKVAKEFARQPRYSATPTGPTRSGTEMHGATGGPRQITEAELAAMTPEQIVAAQEAGQMNALLGRT